MLHTGGFKEEKSSPKRYYYNFFHNDNDAFTIDKVDNEWLLNARQCIVLIGLPSNDTINLLKNKQACSFQYNLADLNFK